MKLFVILSSISSFWFDIIPLRIKFNNIVCLFNNINMSINSGYVIFYLLFVFNILSLFITKHGSLSLYMNIVLSYDLPFSEYAL